MTTVQIKGAAPTKLNGYPVVRCRQHENGYTTVMVEKPGEHVVATWWPELRSSWSWGHYFSGADSFEKAQTDFVETAKRNEYR